MSAKKRDSWISGKNESFGFSGGLKGTLAFMSLTNSFREIKRKILIKGSSREENDSEHSFQLALLAWRIIEMGKLKLDLEKVFKYALCHDLAEVYAGDTYFYAGPKRRQEKVIKEKAAWRKLEKNSGNSVVFFPRPGDTKN